MDKSKNLMNSSWFGEKSEYSNEEIKANLLKADTESKVLIFLIEMFKLGDFTQKPLLVQLMNQTNDEAVLNLCIRVYFSICTHDDLNDSNSMLFLENASADTIRTFASAATTSLSLDAIPYLLSLLEEWYDINDIAVVLRDSIDFFINYEEDLGEEATVDDIGEYYLNYTQQYEVEKYYFGQKLAFPGDLAKRIFERVMLAINNEDIFKMEFIPSVLSIWTGIKVPAEYDTVINKDNYKNFISYIEGLSTKEWEKGEKYFYGYKI
ncbi:hypothetical protein BBD42_01065 [Paenibacillus sp. BIHB 4019]|uniref:Uncharacterized protein n=1 Tax=Paenibacillus sp. BIHB 4019 TaxID=1870819 RepID=A0A1B2DC00_9BACL|nr:Imm47 family immunity protein [Paenibacillus sp. BIHB 4019]ANY65225.1 hypothetical protein BBD42_01065 [Paenibacillus sp. BIHB 4019]